MGLVRYTYRVDAPPERVFEFGLNAERIPEWNTSFVEVKDISGPLDRVGATYTATVRAAGRMLETRWEVVRFEKPFYFEQKGTTPGGWAKTVTKLEPIGSGTEVFVELEYELPGGFLGQFANKLFVERAIERDLRHSSDNYKAIIEAEVPVLA